MCQDRELLRLLPRVLRARDFYLYLEGGKRLTDLWRDGGKAVLGHKPPKVLRELKNAAERGLFCPLPHPMERRFIKALEKFFPGRSFRLFLNESSLYRALEEAGYSGPFQDPAFPPYDPGKGKVSLWRPFLEKVTDTAPETVIDTIFIPVLPWSLGPAVLVLDKSVETSFPPGELIPPVLLAPAVRAVHDLAALMKAPVCRPYRKIEKALGGQQSGLWRRRGIYLSTGAEEYAALFMKFLEGGFLLPPSRVEPAILPFTMSDGEESKLAQLLVN